MARASSDALDKLHATVAKVLTEELVRAKAAAEVPRTILTKDAKTGECISVKNPAFEPLNPQLIDKVLKMLKDNGIDSPAKSEAISALAQALDDIDLDQATYQ